MRKIGMYIVACLLVFGIITPAQAETVSSWDVTGTGTNPYTLTFTGEGMVNLESETKLVFEDGLTGQAIDIAKNPVVTFTAETAPVVKVTSTDQAKTILIQFGREVKAEPTPEEPVTTEPAPEEEATPEEPVKEEPVEEEPATEEPVKEEPVKEEPKPETEPVKEEPVQATTAIINGTIWYDENEDGIRQEKETGISDVPVYLLNKNYDVVEEVYTKDGLYTFKDIKPGTYYVEVYGMDIGYYYTSPQHEGTDPTIDSDLDEEDLAKVKLKAGDIVQVDAGLYGLDDEEMDMANLLIVTNFLDANADQIPGYSEQTIPATYTVTDAITGKDVYTEEVGKDDALSIELTPGTYTVKTEVAAGYTVEAMHHVSLDEMMDSFELTKAGAEALAVGMADEDEEEFPGYDEFLKLFKRKATTDSVTLTDETMGYFLLAEIKKAKPVVAPKPEPTPQPTETSATPAQAPVTEVQADNPETGGMSGERLPQAGEDQPFPYAATGAGLAVVGLWLLLRRAG